MRKNRAQILVLTLVMTFASPAWSQQVIDLTWDPYKDAPTIVSRSTKNSKRSFWMMTMQMLCGTLTRKLH